ncbi:hypothetical protein [Pseudonocardia sp. TMWB2A]|uniref:hypothetical protein n=1 Tax=Pseudonocardia sp. TMWB2A TaxID=687430 RepID=UPI00307E8FB7
MTFRLFLLIVASVSLSALAQLALKIGTSAAKSGASGAASASASGAGLGGEMGALLQSPMVYVGLGLYGFGALLWLFVLGRAPLSLAYPFVGMGFILTMAAGSLYLGEHLSAGRLIGTLLIAAGCVLVARSA